MRAWRRRIWRKKGGSRRSSFSLPGKNVEPFSIIPIDNVYLEVFGSSAVAALQQWSSKCSRFPGPGASSSPGNLLRCKSPGPSAELLNQKLEKAEPGSPSVNKPSMPSMWSCFTKQAGWEMPNAHSYPWTLPSVPQPHSLPGGKSWHRYYNHYSQ